MTNLKLLLGSNIKIYRRACGLSQSSLAERVDTATNYIAAIEAGRRFPSVTVLEKLASALGVDTPELFSVQSVQNEITKQEMEVRIWQDIEQYMSEFIGNNLSKAATRR